jgi:hypothetical protein
MADDYEYGNPGVSAGWGEVFSVVGSIELETNCK